MEWKYIIFNDCFPVIFPIALSHDNVAKIQGSLFEKMYPTSGGFLHFKGNIVSCYGKSMSLDLDSKNTDSEFITKLIQK